MKQKLALSNPDKLRRVDEACLDDELTTRAIAERFGLAIEWVGRRRTKLRRAKKP